MERRSRLSGFTLIELLVVVAIVGLLVAILFPSLQEARERARIVVCQANLRTIGSAALAYRTEHDDLPWSLPRPYRVGGEEYTWRIWSEFSWGGGMPSMPWDRWAPYNVGVGSERDTYQVPPRHRPLNRYFSQAISWDAPPYRHDAIPPERPAEVPGFFRCPSDRTAATPFVSRVENDPGLTEVDRTWQFRGTSYPINWYWAFYYTEAPPGDSAPYYGTLGRILGHTSLSAPGVSPAYRGLGRTMLADWRRLNGSEFVIFFENPFNYAAARSRPPGFEGYPWEEEPVNVEGWHGQTDRHAAAFLDGSGRYQKFDTRSVFGPDWTIWPRKPWKGVWAGYQERLPE